MKRLFLGIDPGASGGLAWISDVACGCEKFAATERDILRQFDAACEYVNLIIAAIERVHSMPKQGVASSFKFGQSYGFLRGLLTAMEIPFEEVTPQTWQKSMGCLSKGDKNVTKQKAQQLFPELKITHATADALLIAEYARRKYAMLRNEATP